MTATAHRSRSFARSPRAWLAISAAAAVVTAGAAVGQGGAIPPGGAKTKANGAKVTLSVTKVKQGGAIRVTGTNWKAKGSRVTGKAEVTVKIDDRHIVAVFPIRNKKFSGVVRIPKQVKPGKHWLRFLAAEPATSVKSKPFTVVRATAKARANR